MQTESRREEKQALGSGVFALRCQEDEGEPAKETQTLGSVPDVRGRKRLGKERMINCDKCD